MTQKSDKPIWKKNLYVLSIAVFIAGIAFSEIMPFLPLYIDTLGHFTHQQLNFWSGFIFPEYTLFQPLFHHGGVN